MYTTWRDRFRPAIAKTIVDARAAGADEKAVRKALRCPYKGGWLAQVWYDECAKQLGSPKGRIYRKTSPIVKARKLARAGQGSLFDE